jgi:hypothetical protein
MGSDILDRDEGSTGMTNAGLCADCFHMRRVESDRRSIFIFCERSKTDRNFPKYPRLPVSECPGYEAACDRDRSDF